MRGTYIQITLSTQVAYHPLFAFSSYFLDKSCDAVYWFWIKREKIITSLLSAVNPWQKLTQMKLAKGALSTASKTYKRKSSCFSHDSQNYAVLIHCHLVHLPVTLLSNKTNLNELIWIRWKIRFLGWECDLLFPWKSGLHFPHCTNR